MGTKKKAKAEPAATPAAAADFVPLKAGDIWTHPETGAKYKAVSGECEKGCAFGKKSHKGECPLPVGEDGMPSCHADNVMLTPDTDEAAPETAPQGKKPGKPAKGKKAKAKPEAVPSAAVSNLTKRQIDVPAGNMIHAAWNVREDMSEESITDLVASIRAVGLIHRITVRSSDLENPACESYTILAGHRRYEACVLAGMTSIPCELVECDDKQALMITAIENLHRKDLTAMEESEVVEGLLNVGLSAEEVAEQTGRHLRWVYRRASVRGLTKAWRDMAKANGLCAAFLEVVARYPENTQALVFKGLSDWDQKNIVKGGGAVETVERMFGNVSHSCKTALWGKKHPEWCENCPRCSAAVLELFDHETFKDDGALCLDPVCWGEMTEKWVVEEKARLADKHGECRTVTSDRRYNLGDTRNRKDAGHTIPVMVDEGHAAGTVLWIADKAKPGKGEDGEDEEVKTGPSKAERLMAKEIKRMAEWVLEDGNVANWARAVTVGERLALAMAFSISPCNELEGEHEYDDMGIYAKLLECGDTSDAFESCIKYKLHEYLRSEKVTGCGPVYDKAVKLDVLFGCDRTVARKVQVQE